MDLILSQKLGLTQAMQTSMRLLQMNNLQLRNYIGDLMTSNPVVELEYPEIDYRPGPFDRQFLASRSKNPTDNSEPVSKEELMKDKASNPSALTDLFLQSAAMNLSEPEQHLMEYLICSLDENGFLKESPESIARLRGTTVEEVQRCIQRLQSMDPAGIGAADLKQCLQIQLERFAPEDTIALAIVDSHLEQLAKLQYSAIAKVLQVPKARVVEACECIRTLSPRPLNGSSSETVTQYIIPDFYIVEEQGQLRCLMNDYYLPKITVDPSYWELIRNKTLSKEDSTYIEKNYEQANEITKFLTYRKSTMQRVVEYILTVQTAFFHEGPGHRVAMSNRDIAEALELHESTVSRAVNGKFFECKWGVFPLKSLFMHSLRTNETVAGNYDQILHKLEQLIAGEFPGQAYSDQQLSELLGEEGFPIARRTVAKYRQQLGIPPAGKRKQDNRKPRF